MAQFRTEGREEYIRLEPGRYFWKVIDAKEQYSQRGDDQIKLTLQVGSREKGTMRVVETLTFSEKAYFRVEHFMKSAGIYPGDGIDVDLTAQDCIGLGGVCETIDRISESSGKSYPNVDVWLAANEQRPQRQAARPRQSASAPTAPARISDDDIPF